VQSVSCAVVWQSLDVISEEELQQNALEVGEYLKQGLCELQARHSLIGDVRGRDSFLESN